MALEDDSDAEFERCVEPPNLPAWAVTEPGSVSDSERHHDLFTAACAIFSGSCRMTTSRPCRRASCAVAGLVGLGGAAARIRRGAHEFMRATGTGQAETEGARQGTRPHHTICRVRRYWSRLSPVQQAAVGVVPTAAVPFALAAPSSQKEIRQIPRARARPRTKTSSGIERVSRLTVWRVLSRGQHCGTTITWERCFVDNSAVGRVRVGIPSPCAARSNSTGGLSSSWARR